MENLLQNRLFLQYLSGAGSAISQGEPMAPALNQITQQNISAQSKAGLQQKYMQMLQEMLGGLPTGGSIKGSKDKLTIDVPTSSLANSRQLATEGAQLPGGSGTDWSSPEEYGQLNAFLREGTANPSASPSGISGADLAGLTAADVSQALSGATNVQALKQKKFTDIVDALYKSQIAEDMSKRTNIYASPRAPNALDQPFPVEIPGVGKVSLRQWNAMDKDDRAYAAYVHQASQQSALGTYDEPEVKGIAASLRPDVMTREQWNKEVDKPTQQKYLEALMDDPEMMEAAKELKKSGATNISLGEKVEAKEAFADVKAKKYFTDPKGLVGDVDKYINSEEVQNRLFALDPSQRDRETIREKEKYIMNKITSTGGEIVASRLEGRTFVWSVKWPDGKTSEVRYAN